MVTIPFAKAFTVRNDATSPVIEPHATDVKFRRIETQT